ncbi:ligand-binding sensor domain-containing protein [Olivibacter sitiensis]|uniref:ligand-binding sensor domain-containing protein n=1 Tax=Olivibacter sitiensis TaxID=376470 RepID=UPI0004864604|nr:sensor histidine kinase [Olivibacter sitiensis]
MRITRFLLQTAGVLYFTFLCFRTHRAVAQTYYFNHYQVENGLSNNSVLCSAQDKNGFMWFGTRDGLNRFDGYNFRHFYADTESDHGLGSNFIHSIAVSKDNQIWIGTDQGVYIFDPRKERFTTLEGLYDREILQIEEDASGNIWLIANHELFYYDTGSKQLQKKTNSDWYHVSHFCFDRDGDVWVGARNNLICLTKNIVHPLPIDSSITMEIKKLYVDHNNDIWIGTSKEGLFKYEAKLQHIDQIIANPLPHVPLYIRDVMEVDDRSIWIASEGGLFIYDTQTKDYRLLRHEKDNPWSITDNAIYTISKDHQEGIWIGTYFGGVHYYHPQHTYFEKIFPRSKPNSIRGYVIREMVEDRHHNLWIGTEDQGLTFWNPRENSFETLGQSNHLAHSNIHGMAVSGDSLFVGTFHQGMDVIDIRTHRVVKHFDVRNTNGALGDNFVFSIYRTRAGRILLATSRGAYEFFPGQDRFQPIAHLQKHIFYTSIYEDRVGNIWLSTWRDGAIRLSPQTGDLLRFAHEAQDKQSLNSNRVNRVFQNSKGEIWIATENGIAIWNEKTNKFRRITKEDGLPSNLILGFEEDDDQNLWISTSRGLVKMNTRRYSIEVFDTELGLLGLQFNYNSAFKDTQGYLYFGSSRGLIRFNPQLMTDRYKTNPETPIYITGIQTHQRELTIGGTDGHLQQSVIYTDQIVLNHDESTISIDFAALNFVAAKSTSYLYRLLGLDTAWTFLRSNGKAHFTKVPPGNYTFQVMAADANGTPISQSRSLHIRIKPPLWASTPAYATYLFLALCIICYVVYLYDRRIKEKNRRRLEIIKSHKEQELYKAKMDFFMRITHDIKTPLTLIKGPLERIIHGAPKEKTDKWLHTIHQNTEKLLTLTDNLLDFRKIESNQFSLRLQPHRISKLLQLCLQEFSPLIESKKLILQTDLDEVEADIDIETIYKILTNLLSNAIKYADQTVQVTLKEDLGNQTFRVEVKNDGVRLTEEDIQQIFKPFQRASSHFRIKGSGLGLALAHSFATLHGGSLLYVDNSENLNIFVLEIPL